MANYALHTYNGYKITVRESKTPPVAVFHPLYPKAPALYKTNSLDQAIRWVNAYIKGEAWGTAPDSAGPPPHGNARGLSA